MRVNGWTEVVLSNATAIRILRTLVRFPGREFTGRELALQSGASHPNTLRELGRLSRHGVVAGRRVGRASAWRWNEEHALTAPLDALFDAERQTLPVATDLIRDSLSASPGVRRIVLFGSVARGDEAPDSDIDVYVEVADDAAKHALERALDRLRREIGRRYGNHLAPVVYSVEEARRKKRLPLLVNIEKEGIVLIDRAP